VPLELGSDPGVVVREQRANVLRIECLGSGGRAHEVAEEDGDDLALLASFGLGDKGRSAHAAEPESLRILLATVRTDDRHAGNVRRGGERDETVALTPTLWSCPCGIGRGTKTRRPIGFELPVQPAQPAPPGRPTLGSKGGTR